MRDMFRPHTEPASLIYDAFQAEASHRKGRCIGKWINAERYAVWRVARDWAEQHGRKVPTLDEVQLEERCAMGHIDYGAKWAYGIARLLA